MNNKKIFHTLFAMPLLTLIISCGGTDQNTKNENDMPDSKYRVAFELILENENSADSLLGQFSDFEMDSYRWKNHIVLFGEKEDTSVISQRIHKSGMKVNVKRYQKPMYAFDREIHCGDSLLQKPRKDYLLTANLVEDTAMQNEYIAYHETQFEKWPEVAEGFCNADFQQLLVYRNGRQLLLVISIPADKTLDELNPKTTENNPEMDEWNAIMGKYQEGIEGTVPDETWVFLDKVEN